MSGVSSIHGAWARAHISAVTLTDAQDCALSVGSTGILQATNVATTGTNPAKPAALNGNVARYNINKLALNDGDGCALQVDSHNNLITVQG